MSDKFSINQNDMFNKMLLSNKSNLILELVEKEKPDVIISIPMHLQQSYFLC